MRTIRKYRLWAILLFITVFALDRAVKLATGPDTDCVLLPAVIDLTYAENTGISFGLFAGGNTLMCWVTALLLAVLILFTVFTRSLPLQAALGMIAGGATGNLLDRLTLGYVHDMLHFTFIPAFPVFNIADAGIVCGAVLAALCVLFTKENGENAKKA